MRIALIILGILLFATTAHAAGGSHDSSSSESFSRSHDSDRHDSNDWWFGHRQRGFNQGGLSLRLRGDNFSAFFGTDGFGHPNDRGGYRVFIPRGQQGSVYYDNNDRVYRSRRCDPNYGYPYSSGYGNAGGYCSHGNYGGCSYCGSGTVVIPYGYNSYYSQQAYNSPIWTAPDYPEYGYYQQYANEPRWSDYAYDEPLREERAQPQIYNDNRTYNYYGNSGEASRGQAPAAPSQDSRPVQHEPTDGAAANSRGPNSTRFTSQAEIEFDGNSRIFRIIDGVLSVSSGAGPGLPIIKDVDSELGVYALSQPGNGLTLVFRQGDKLVAARPAEGDAWTTDVLPYDVDFSETLSTGAISGEPWVVFTDLSGSRYVVGFDVNGWFEVGSGSR